MNQIEILDITHAETAQEVFELQKLAYQVEASLSKDDKIPYLIQGLSDLMRSEDETFVGYRDEDGQIRAVFSYKLTNEGVLDVHRLMVHPSLFRQGIGSKLLDYVLERNVVRKIIAQTRAQNKPAIEFYNRNGIDFVCEIQVDKSTRLATFERVIMSLEEYRQKVGAEG